MIPTTQGPLRADQRPLYAQASEAIRILVVRGGYAPGDRLPSEIELSRQLGISRPTLREALRLLEDDGTIIRRHGVGTFVARFQLVIESGLEVLESIDRIAQRLGLQTGMAGAAIEERPASPRELRGLNLTNEMAVTAVTRVITTDGQRIAHLIDIVPQEYLHRSELLASKQCSAATAGREFHGSVLDYLLARGWPTLSHSRTELSAEAADPELAHALNVPRGAPLLRLEAQLYAQDGRVIDYSISHFVPGHFRFHVVRRIG